MKRQTAFQVNAFIRRVKRSTGNFADNVREMAVEDLMAAYSFTRPQAANVHRQVRAIFAPPAKQAPARQPRTLFRAAIALVLDSRNSYVHRNTMRRTYTAYLAAFYQGDADALEVFRKQIWNMLIDSNALQTAYATK